MRPPAAGIGQWNGRSGTTGVVFEPAPPGSTSADLEFQPDASQIGGCAAYTPRTDRVYYDPNAFLRAAQDRPDYAAGIAAHELGHFLGLDEAGDSPSPPSIMNNPFVPLAQPCHEWVVPTTTVQANDAQRVPSCISQARQQSAQETSYPYTEPNYSFSPACYYYYEVTDYYLCGGWGCSYWHSNYRYMGSSCMLTQ